MQRHRCLALTLTVFVVGCSEGTKADPLPRAKPEVVQKGGGKTLYERLGQEENLTKTAEAVIATLAENSKSQPLSTKLSKRALVEFLMGAATRPRPRLGDDLMLTSPEWAQLIPALRVQLKARSIPDVDTEELLANIEKSR